MPISLQQVAEKAGVSGATVSRVLNGKWDRIPPSTRDRVRLIARELGYQPNRLARSLREGKTGTIGLMIAGLQNPFFVSVMEAAEKHAEEKGYEVLLDAGRSVRGSYYEHQHLRNWPVDGVIIWAMANQTITDFLGAHAAETPVVYLGFTREDDTDWVAFDFAEAERRLVGHLADRGYRKLCYVSPYDFHDPVRSCDLRVAAYLETCRARGCDPGLMVMDPQEETRSASLATGLRIAALPPAERPEALVCHNDVIAIGVYHGLRRAGLRVPEEIAVAGFDGIEEGQFLDTPLTTIRTPAEDLCAAAMETLTSRLTGGKDHPRRRILVPGELLPGGTA